MLFNNNHGKKLHKLCFAGDDSQHFMMWLTAIDRVLGREYSSEIHWSKDGLSIVFTCTDRQFKKICNVVNSRIKANNYVVIPNIVSVNGVIL